MNIADLYFQLSVTLLLVWMQRAVRLFIRAIWMGAAAYLSVWVAHVYWGFFPNPKTWLAAGMILATPSLVGIILPWPRLSRLAWALDRRLGLREQISAAWETAQTSASGQVPAALLADATGLLEQAQVRILRRGWFLGRDLLSGLIVATLFLLFSWANLGHSLPDLPGAGAVRLPALGEDPRAEQVFPSGLPGLVQPPPASALPGQSAADNPGAEDRLTEGDLSASQVAELTQALQDLGAALSQNAATYDAGQDLQSGDLDRSAEGLERLADQLDQLGGETREQVAEALQETAGQIPPAGQPEPLPLAEDLQAAGEALAGGDSLNASESLDQAAAGLRDLAGQMAAQAGSPLSAGSGGEQAGDRRGALSDLAQGDSRRGEPEPFTRFSEEGEAFELSGSSDRSGLLSPGEPGSEVEDLPARGAYNFTAPGDSDPISTVLTPYYYSWIWRDVVSTYFTPR